MKIKMCKITKYQNVENHILLKQKLVQIEFIRDSRDQGTVLWPLSLSI